jgi:methionine biosynthesis protein MetW
MIDRELNYGRHHIERFLTQTQMFSVVVDLGAGQGDDLYLAQKVNPSVVLHAVEVFPPYAQALQKKGIIVHSLDIEKDSLPFPDQSVDVIIMNQVVEHVKEVFWIFHEITRVLKVGGSLIVGVPNIAAWHNRILLLFGQQPTPLKNWSAHVRGWTKHDFALFLNNCFPSGYKLTDFGGSNFYPFPPFVAKPLAHIFPNAAWGIFMHWQKVAVYKDQFVTYPIQQQLETNFYTGQVKS